MVVGIGGFGEFELVVYCEIGFVVLVVLLEEGGDVGLNMFYEFGVL